MRNVASRGIGLLLIQTCFIIAPCVAEPVPPELSGRHYYYVETGYTCRGMTGGEIETYRDQIFFHRGNICLAGDGCNDAVACSPVLPPGLVVSPDRKTLSYQNKSYEYRTEPPGMK